MEPFKHPDAEHNNQSDNIELSWVAAIAEDELRDEAIKARSIGEVMHDSGFHSLQLNPSTYYNEANRLSRTAEMIGYAILARETGDVSRQLVVAATSS